MAATDPLNKRDSRAAGTSAPWPGADPNIPYTGEERGQTITLPRLGGGGRPVSLVGFLVALVLLGVVLFVLPPKARPWLALLVVMGAIVVNDGVASITEFGGKIFKGGG